MFFTNLFSRIVAALRSAIKKMQISPFLLCHTKSAYVNLMTVKAKAILANASWRSLHGKDCSRVFDLITVSIEWRLIVHSTIGASSVELINQCNCRIISLLTAAIWVPQISPSTVELIVLVSMGVTEKKVEVDGGDLQLCCLLTSGEGKNWQNCPQLCDVRRSRGTDVMITHIIRMWRISFAYEYQFWFWRSLNLRKTIFFRKDLENVYEVFMIPGVNLQPSCNKSQFRRTHVGTLLATWMKTQNGQIFHLKKSMATRKLQAINLPPGRLIAVGGQCNVFDLPCFRSLINYAKKSQVLGEMFSSSPLVMAAPSENDLWLIKQFS